MKEQATKSGENKGTQVPPRSAWYEGGYVKTNMCQDCERRGFHYDVTIGDPCRECGGRVLPSGPAKWNHVIMGKETITVEVKTKNFFGFTSKHMEQRTVNKTIRKWVNPQSNK
tara:strand:- start:18427 stop:18765 length:339 start_codon:yes stop_codon:yes gene_type:complete